MNPPVKSKHDENGLLGGLVDDRAASYALADLSDHEPSGQKKGAAAGEKAEQSDVAVPPYGHEDEGAQPVKYPRSAIVLAELATAYACASERRYLSGRRPLHGERDHDQSQEDDQFAHDVLPLRPASQIKPLSLILLSISILTVLAPVSRVNK
jgi:hypothetical protein